MKTAEAGICFPVLAFTPDQILWQIESLDILTRCGPRTLKNDMQAGMEIVDAELNRWVVRSVRRVGRAEAFLPWLFGSLVHAPQSRIEHELESLPPITIEEAQARVFACIEAHPDYWCNESEQEEVLIPLMAKIRRTRSVTEICKAVGPDDFRGY